LTNMENSTRLLFDTCTVFFLPKYIPFVSCKIQLHGHVVSLCLLVSIPIVQSAFSMFVLFLLAEMSQELICWFYVRVFVYRGASTLNDFIKCVSAWCVLSWELVFYAWKCMCRCFLSWDLVDFSCN
jgi:hypothetical protein